MSARRVGFMGGGFDPIHWGHVGAAIEVGYRLGLEVVYLSATGQPPHKAPVASAEHRFEMTRLAALEYPTLRGTGLESGVPGPHFTVGTLERLRAQEPDAELHLIVGEDAARTLDTWKALPEIRRLARIVVAARAGDPSGARDGHSGARDGQPGVVAALTAEAGAVDYNPGVPGGDAPLVRWPGVAVSSTEIRRRVREGAPIEYLVPRSVADYLRRHDLYR